MTLTRTVEESTGVPAGVYVARVKALEEDDGQYGAQIKFYFEIKQVLACDHDDPDQFIGEEKWGWCSDKLTPNSKLFKWSKQILGDLEIGDPIDLDDMVGQLVRITVGENKNGNLAVTDLAAHRSTKKAKSNGRKREPEPEYDEEEDAEETDDF